MFDMLTETVRTTIEAFPYYVTIRTKLFEGSRVAIVMVWRSLAHLPIHRMDIDPINVDDLCVPSN